MTRWRVDFLVKSDLVLAEDGKRIVFSAPDDSHEIHLFTKLGPGKHAADELYLSAHVILHDDDPKHAADDAQVLLRRFLDMLAIVTCAYYRVERRILVVDWSPRLDNREFLLFSNFPNPNVPFRGIRQGHLDSVHKLTENEVPHSIQLASHWWALGASAPIPNEQFQFFWYALEILAEHTKPSSKIASKCPICSSELFCPTCNKAPLHRPYPKEAIKILVENHVKGEQQQFFELIDKARNGLLHGDDPKEIERRLDVKWSKLSDSLGKTTWAALRSVLVTNAAAKIDEPETLAFNETNTFTHYTAGITTRGSMSANHADPANPQIEEFHPGIQINMIVKEKPENPSDVEN